MLVLYAKISVAEKLLWEKKVNPVHFGAPASGWTFPRKTLNYRKHAHLWGGFQTWKDLHSTGLWTLCGRLSLSQRELVLRLVLPGCADPSPQTIIIPDLRTARQNDRLQTIPGTGPGTCGAKGGRRKPVLTPCLTVFAAWAAFFFAS